MLFKYLVVFSIFSTASFVSIGVENCGKRPLVENSKIINGNVSIPGDWGWSVSIQTGNRHYCGGVLINENYVLSAAHCFSSSTPSVFDRVLIGLHNRQFKEEWVITRSISKLFRHQNYNSFSLKNDIALLKLNEPVVFDEKYIVAACIDEENKSGLEPEGKIGWLTGWGDTYYQSNAGTIEKNLGSLDILTNQRCKQKYGANIFDADSQICGAETNANAGACQGDSGGPMVQQGPDGKWYLQGLISWGYGCGDGTIFTRVKYYLPWIRQKMDLL